MDWCRLGSKEHKIVPLTYDFLLTFSLSSHILILCHQTIPGTSSVAHLIARWNIGNCMNCRWLDNLFRHGLSSLGNREDSFKYTLCVDLRFYTSLLLTFFLDHEEAYFPCDSWCLNSRALFWKVSNLARTGLKDKNAWSKQHLVYILCQQWMQQRLLKHVKKFVAIELF